MKLLFVYIGEFRIHNSRSFNLDANERFVLEGNQLKIDSPVGLVPENFFHKSMRKARGLAQVSSRVDSISAVIGENGSGKTSLAEFLNSAFAEGKCERQFLYILKLEGEKDIQYLCVNNLPYKVDDSQPRKHYGRAWVSKHYDVEVHSPAVGLVYYSPFYTARTDWFIGSNDAFVDVSTVGRLRGKSAREYDQMEARTIDRIVDRFAARKRAFFKNAPMICPAEVVARVNEGYVASIQRAVKKDDFLGYNWGNRLVAALDIVEIPDIIVKMAASLMAGLVERYLAWSKQIRAQELNLLDSICAVCEAVIKRYHNHHVKEFGHRERSWMVDKLRCELTDDVRQDLRARLIAALRKNLLQQEFSTAGHRSVPDVLPSRRLTTAPVVSFVDAAMKLSAGAEALDDEIEFKVRSDEDRKSYYDFKGAYAILLRKVYNKNKGFPLAFETKGLSAGELSYLSMMGRLDEVIGDQSNERNRIRVMNLILFLDEAETTLHPEWQRLLVENIVWYVENFTKDLRVHVIFASHSPTLLSDLPRGNVCVLPRRSESKRDCQVPSIETFGMNIYDLYRVMATERGCISGRFSSAKIKGMMEHVPTARDRELIEMVGDPLIRAYLESLARKSERKDFV